MSMVNGKWDGLYMKGHAPTHIIWQNWDKKQDKKPVPEDWGWSKFAEIDRGACKYAGYENDVRGEEDILYLRFSLKTGEVTGIKSSIDLLEFVSKNWNDYDTPKSCKGRKYDPYLYKIRIEEND